MNTEKITSQIYNFEEYLHLVKALVAEGKSTGPDQSEEIVYYTGLNLVRMERILKVSSINEELSATIQALEQDYRFVVLTEAWCGDAAQIVPIFYFIENASHGKITLELLLRDENLTLMDQHLTNGGRSIPKLIVYNAKDEVVATWGPRPQVLTDYMQQLKEENEGMEFAKLVEKIQLWYAKDRTLSVQKELTELLHRLS